MKKSKLIEETGLNDLQADVVLDLSKELIVPAGAGSGKTKTLVTKVVYLLQQGYQLDNFLVLTFTKKAALEMKLRIKSELAKLGMDDIIAKIDSSDISTFDSFAYNFVKQNASVIGLDSNLELLDQAIFNTKKTKFLEEIIVSIMNDENNSLYTFVRDYTDRTSSLSLINDLMNFYEKLINLKPLREYSQEDLFKEVELFNNINIRDLIFEISGEFLEANEEALQYLFNEASVVTGLLSENTLPKKTFSWKMLEDCDKKTIQSLLKPYTEIAGLNLTKEDLDEILEDFNAEIEKVFEILYLYEEKLDSFKTKFNKYEFRDIANFLNIILKSDEETLIRAKDKYKLVFVDEYQDTSLVQSEFLELLIKDNEDIKVLYVGDIKQSIYKFRDAKPDTFINKQETVNMISLTTNYRSSPNIIDFVNNIFNNILISKELHDIEYKKDNHEMLSGTIFYTKEDLDADVFLLEVFNEKGKQDLVEEAFIIGYKIRELIKLEKVEGYKDIAILSRNTRVFSIYRDVFNYLNIPLQVQVDFSLKETYMLKLISNILNLSLNLYEGDLDRKRFDYISLTRSEIYALSDFEIFTSVIKDGKTLNINSDIYIKLANLNKVINTKTNIEVIDFLINEFDIYKSIIKAPKQQMKELQIDYLYSISKVLNELDIVGRDFVNFIDEISYNEDLNIKIPIHQDSDENSVIITNIHQSKGLEYNTLFLTELNKSFTKERISKFKYLSESKTLIRKPYNNNRDKLVKLINDTKINNESRDTLKEELRLLYVAITRAEKALYILGYPNTDIDNLNSYNDYLYYGGMRGFIKPNNITTYTTLNKESDYYLHLNDTNFYYPKEIDSIRKFNFSFLTEEIKKVKASTSINKLISNKERAMLVSGNKLHSDFEYGNGISRLYSHKINNKSIKDGIIFKELEYSYLDNNKQVKGIIDLVVEFDELVLVIDYKTLNLDDPNYIKQLASYKDYLSKVYDKEIKTYLYSVVKDKLEEIDIK